MIMNIVSHPVASAWFNITSWQTLHRVSVEHVKKRWRLSDTD